MASAVILARVRQAAPELSALSDAQIAAWADSTSPYLHIDWASPWKFTGNVIGGTVVTFWDEATALLTAHLLTRMPTSTGSTAGGSSAFPVAADMTGDLSQHYAVPSGAAITAALMDLGSTRYGMQFDMFKRSRAAVAAPTVIV